MRAIFAGILVIGLGLAFFAANMIKGYMNQQEVALQQTRQAAEQRLVAIEVIAVKESVKYGDQLTPDSLQTIRYAQDFLPEGAFTSMEEVFPEGQDVVRTVLRPMEPLEPLLAIKVTAPGASGGLVTRLDKGMRAFAIQTDVSSGVSGFLHPGDRVDVYWSGHVSSNSKGEVTRLIRSAIEILAVDQTDDTTRSGAMIARTVTVKASTQDVAALAQAQATGRLSLALVGANDEAVAEVIEIDQRELLGIEEVKVQEVVEAPVEEVCTIRNRRGGEVVETPVPCKD